MELEFLPSQIYSALKKIDITKLYQIRLRTNYPIKIVFGEGEKYLGKNGAEVKSENGIICTENILKEVIYNATERSLYAYNDKICKGFIPVRGGGRIGVAGECVYENNRLITIKNFSSLNIRIPHSVEGCSKTVYNYVASNGIINNTLIVSPPFCGKTTVLKDLAVKLNGDFNKSIIVIDERGEFEGVSGENIDVIRFSDKLFAFEYGVRSLSPEIIITDELSSAEDWNCALKAVSSGVKIIASCHGENLSDILKNDRFIAGIFDKYVFLKEGCFGVLDKVFDKECKRI